MNEKIFWGLDPFEESSKLNIFVGETLASLNQKLKADIHPVFTLGAEVVSATSTFMTETFNAMTKISEDKMWDILNKVNIVGALPPQVICENSLSRTKIVKHFINRAETNGATLIAVGTHGRKGLDRAVLGSFAETLLLNCHMPVLVVGQEYDQIPKWDKILFATDFSDDSSYAFHKALALAKVLSAKLVLFHHINPLVDPLIQSAIAPFGGVWFSYREEVEILKEKQSKKIEEWAKVGKADHVDIETSLDTGTTDTSEAILSYANTHEVGLIMMASESNSLEATLWGTISRKIVRQSKSPVWLLRRR